MDLRSLLITTFGHTIETVDFSSIPMAVLRWLGFLERLGINVFSFECCRSVTAFDCRCWHNTPNIIGFIFFTIPPTILFIGVVFVFYWIKNGRFPKLRF